MDRPGPYPEIKVILPTQKQKIVLFSPQPIQGIQSIQVVQPIQGLQPIQIVQPIQGIQPIQPIQVVQPIQGHQPIQIKLLSPPGIPTIAPSPSLTLTPSLLSPSLSLPSIVPETQPIVSRPILPTLFDYQVPHYQKLSEILNRFYFAIDGSTQGSGKTEPAITIGIEKDLPMLILSPKVVHSHWKTKLAQYQVPVVNLNKIGPVLTYDKLRSKKNSQPKHGLLKRIDGKGGVRFIAEPLLHSLLEHGILIVFDEFQKIKNDSDQTKSVRAIMNEVIATRGRSRMLFLSGTPIDEPEQCITHLRTIGLIKQRNLYSKTRKGVRLEGIADLYQWGELVNPAGLVKFRAENPFVASKETVVNYVFEFFLAVLKPFIMSVMPNPLERFRIVKNGFFQMTPADKAEYIGAVEHLEHAVVYNPKTRKLGLVGEDPGNVTLALRKIQVAKSRNMVPRIARAYLNSRPINSKGQVTYPKIIIYSSYYESIDLLLNALAEFNPVELTGRIEHTDRNIQLFQEPSNNCRVLIANPMKGLGISLHDVTGIFPRITLYLPDYRVNDSMQALYRTTRPGITEPNLNIIVYGISGEMEHKIISSMYRKGQTARRTTIEQTETGAQFPDTYENFFEPELL